MASVAGKHAGSALLQRAQAAGPLFRRTQASTCSSESTNYSTRQVAERIQYIKAREMAMLQGLAYEKPGLAPVHVPTAPQVSKDLVKNRAVLIAAIGVLSGIGWYALSPEGGAKTGQLPDAPAAKAGKPVEQPDASAAKAGKPVEQPDAPGAKPVDGQQADSPAAKPDEKTVQ